MKDLKWIPKSDFCVHCNQAMELYEIKLNNSETSVEARYRCPDGHIMEFEYETEKCVLDFKTAPEAISKSSEEPIVKEEPILI